MRKTSLVRRYARALIEIGKEEGVYEKYGRELGDLAAALKTNPILYKMFLNPMYKLEERVLFGEKICETLGAGKTVKKFFSILIEKRGVRLIEDIAGAYSRMEDELSGRVRAEVFSAGSLDEAFLNLVKEKLSSAAKLTEGIMPKEVILSFSRRPELIGGIIVRIGNKILDGSLKTQLEKMKGKLLEGAIL